MTKSIPLEDVEQFSLVRRVPRESITPAMLAGVKQLDERIQIEPFLRSIIHDTTETPHGSTEIADIFTKQINYGGRARLAAFVNKGKATSSVRMTNVGYQVSKLRPIPKLDLMVLLATGDVQDDIRAHLIQTAQDAAADYMIVDAEDIARMFIAYQKVCPKDGTAYVEGVCPTCGTSADEPIELTIKVLDGYHWDYLERHDVSHAGAKRYTANVLASPHYPKAALREVVKEVAWDLRQWNDYRSEITEARFGAQPADCVFMFIYPTLRDAERTNWVCRAQWIRPDLPDRFKPIAWEGETTAFKGDENLGNISIDWNDGYESRRGLFEYEGRQNWARRIEALLPDIESRASLAANLYEARRSGETDDAAFGRAMQALEAETRDITQRASVEKLPPIECKDADHAFTQLVHTLHNICVPFASWAKKKRDWKYHEWHVRTYLGYFREHQDAFRHEWKKVR